MLTIADLKNLQAQNPDWQMELVDGSIVVVGPSDYASDEISIEFARVLANWVRPRKLGRVTGSAAGFILPKSEEEEEANGSNTQNEPRNLRAPDVSFVLADKLKRTKRDFVELVPDLVVEVKSKTDRVKALVKKIELFIELGSTIGILIDPDDRTLIVYRQSQKPVLLRNGDTLTVPELLPGWELVVSDLWPPVFE